MLKLYQILYKNTKKIWEWKGHKKKPKKKKIDKEKEKEKVAWILQQHSTIFVLARNLSFSNHVAKTCSFSTIHWYFFFLKEKVESFNITHFTKYLFQCLIKLCIKYLKILTKEESMIESYYKYRLFSFKY